MGVAQDAALELTPDDTALTVFDRLAVVGADALIEAFVRLEQGTLPLCPQDDAQATHATLLTKEDGQVRWNDSAENIYNRYRGVMAWPGSYTVLEDKPLKLLALRPTQAQPGRPGEIISKSADGLTVACGEGAVLLQTVQPSGKPKMAAQDFANGYGVKVGSRFTYG